MWISRGVTIVAGGLVVVSAILWAGNTARGNDQVEIPSLLGAAAPTAATGDFLRVVTLQDYNTRVVLIGTMLLGVSGGLVGVFLSLRRRSLTADVVSHTTLPGIAVAFLALEVISPGSGKSTPILLLGAFLSGWLGMACTVAIVRFTRIQEDAALAIVLSVFFGLGIALFTVVQNLPTGNAAGLTHYIYGKAASMVASDIYLIGGAAFVVVAIFGLLFKEWTVVSFDDSFAAAQGWPVVALDGVLFTLVTVVTVIGLQSVGMLLVVALMIIPATAARFWTNNLKKMALIAATLGGVSSAAGVLASALFPRLAAGAVIVLAGSTMFLFSLFFGIRHGVVVRSVHRYLRDLRIEREHLLRALFECVESRHKSAEDWDDRLTETTVSREELFEKRSWSLARLQRLVHAAEQQGDVVDFGSAGIRLTEHGAALARHVVRRHRLWEIYLIEFADRSPNRVDRDADDFEHEVGPEMAAQLERLLTQRYPALSIPPSPHVIPAASEEVPR